MTKLWEVSDETSTDRFPHFQCLTLQCDTSTLNLRLGGRGSYIGRRYIWCVKGGIEVENPARSFVVDDRVVMHLQARVEAVERAHSQRVRLKALGGRAVRLRQARKEAQIATNVQVRAWARVTAEEHRAEHLGCLRLRLVASVRGGGLRKRGALGLAVWAREGEWRGRPGHRERHGRPGDVAAPLAAPDEGRLPKALMVIERSRRPWSITPRQRPLESGRGRHVLRASLCSNSYWRFPHRKRRVQTLLKGAPPRR